MRARFLLPLLLVVAACTAPDADPDPRSPEMFRSFSAGLDRAGGNPAFDGEIARLIRAQRYDEAERELRLRIDGAPPSALKAATLATSADDLRFAGWERVLARIQPLPRGRPPTRRVSRLEVYERFHRGKPAVTAVGIDISHAIVRMLRSEEDALELEVAYYSNGPYPFSRSDRAALLAASASYSPVWQGEFEDVDVALSVTGLTPLLLELRRQGPVTAAPDRVDEMGMRSLAHWWAILALDRALAGEVARLSPRRPVPFIVGTHDFGAFINTIHYPGGA